MLSSLHILTAFSAMVLGTVVVTSRKGTAFHRLLGYSYVAAMLALNLTALGIYRLTEVFGPFHWAAVVSLATLVAGFVPVFLRWPARQWLDLHLRFMAWSYIGLLAAAASEAMVRLPAAPFWPAVVGSSLLVIVTGAYLLERNRRKLTAPFASRV